MQPKKRLAAFKNLVHTISCDFAEPYTQFIAVTGMVFQQALDDIGFKHRIVGNEHCYL
jgi:hypothetical protein